MPFLVETKATVRIFFILDLEKGLTYHFYSEMELKVGTNLVFKILNKIKEAN